MPLKKINTQSRDLQIVQDNVDQVVTSLEGMALNRAVLIQNVSLDSTKDNLIAHTLQRTPQFWFLADQDTSTNVYSPASSLLSNKSSNTTYLNLRCGANCTVSIWVG